MRPIEHTCEVPEGESGVKPPHAKAAAPPPRNTALNFAIALAFAAVALALAWRVGVAGEEPQAVLQGVCRELLAGTTEGRQALVGSCWFGPLPLAWSAWCVWVASAWGCDSTLALVFAAWCGWALALYRMGRLIPECRWTQLGVQAAGTVGIAACGGAFDPSIAMPVWLGITAAGACANWASTRTLGALSMLGFAMGGLGLCGLSLAGWTVWVALALPAITLGFPDVRRRMPAVLVLGWLPLLYAVGVWALLNRLLLGDSLYFLRSLTADSVLVWKGWPGMGDAGHRLSVALGVTAVGMGFWRRRSDGVWLGILTLGAWGWGRMLLGSSASWAETAPLATMLGVVAVVRVAGPAMHAAPGSEAQRFGEVALRLSALGMVSVTILALAVCAWFDNRRVSCAERLAVARRSEAQAAAVCRSVETYVNGRTRYGRVFVCGYEGLALLRKASRNRLIPNLDLHVAELRRLYRGQTLFILVHKPIGRAVVDSVQWQFPEAYRDGMERTLHARYFGDWRLFEVVGAPTEEQLREWRHPPTR